MYLKTTKKEKQQNKAKIYLLKKKEVKRYLKLIMK